MPVKGGSKCIKYLLFGFNFIFWVSERRLSRALLQGHLFSGSGQRPGPLGVTAAGSAGSCWYCGRQADPGREEKGATAASWPRVDRQVGGRGKWVGVAGVLVVWTARSALGSLSSRGFEMGTVSAPTRSTPECETGGKVAGRNGAAFFE